jgi:hypothetical protein
MAHVCAFKYGAPQRLFHGRITLNNRRRLCGCNLRAVFVEVAHEESQVRRPWEGIDAQLKNGWVSIGTNEKILAVKRIVVALGRRLSIPHPCV